MMMSDEHTKTSVFPLSEEDEKPADLNQKIVFKSKKSKTGGSVDDAQVLDRKAKKKKQKEAQSKLSFGDDDEEGEEEDWVEHFECWSMS